MSRALLQDMFSVAYRDWAWAQRRNHERLKADAASQMAWCRAQGNWS